MAHCVRRGNMPFLPSTVPKMPGQRDYSGGATVGRLDGGNVQGPPALAGLFAGGMPALRKTGNRMETGESMLCVSSLTLVFWW